MSLLLDALRRLEVGPPAKLVAAASPSLPPAPEPRGVPQLPRAVRVEETIAPAAEPPIAVAEVEPDTVAPPAMVVDELRRSEETDASLSTDATPPTPDWSASARAPQPPTWEAAYYVDERTPAEVGSAPLAVEPVAESAPAVLAPAVFATDTATSGTGPAVETPPIVELPRAPRAFDCRSLAAAVRRLRPGGGRLAFVSIGDVASTTGIPEWSAELADELGAIAALPVERFASGGLTIDGDEPPLHARNAYRFYFVGGEFAARRGAILRGLDGVVLVIHEGATSIKAAEVVRGALAAQHVEFAGFVYVTR